MKKFIILGGYGNTGKLVAELLLKETDAELVIAGRNAEKAASTAEKLNSQLNTNRTRSISVDAANIKNLESCFTDADCVVAASSTIQYVENVARAAINTNTDYLDTQLSTEYKIQTLRGMEKEINDKQLCFITDGGFHPGVPAALVRYAAAEMDHLESANIYSAIKINWAEYQFSESTILEMVEEFKDFKALAYREKKWQSLNWKEFPKYDFTEYPGVQNCYPMYLEELRNLPELIPTLQETGFYVSGFNWFVDYIATPIMFMGLKRPDLFLKPVSALFVWGLKTFSKPPFKTLLVLEAKSKNQQMQIRLSHNDAYFLTAVPVTACLKQYMNGEKKCGLWFQSQFVEPKEFLKEIAKMGITVNIKV